MEEAEEQGKEGLYDALKHRHLENTGLEMAP